MKYKCKRHSIKIKVEFKINKQVGRKREEIRTKQWMMGVAGEPFSLFKVGDCLHGDALSLFYLVVNWW